MRTIAHLSDLHFGTVDPVIADGLARQLQSLKPSLVVVSGDLTQRARRGQFLEAKRFLERLPRPQLVVPGNHDVPLYDVLRRFGSPLGRYKSVIQTELNPTYSDEELFVAGVNTARSLTWKSGRVSEDQIAQLRERLKGARGRFKVIVTHHPFIPPPMSPEAGIDLGRAADALTVLEDYRVDLLLAGHLHHGYAGDTRAHFDSARRSIIAAQAGTATSRRVREEPNAFNWITLDQATITIQMMAWDGSRFTQASTQCYTLTGDAWIPEC